ncbi:MAG: segregation and condensation protein A [Gammaproteobacteria bacterium]|nr:segregation and condensation protein A [Gammaproteobacteria bacterium]
MREGLQKERDIMMVMRKVLTSIVREVTPEHKGLQHPLSDQTIQDIRNCLGLITAREKELAEEAGRTTEERPHFTDEVKQSTVVPMTKIGKIDRAADKD